MLPKKILILLFVMICVTRAAVDESSIRTDKGFRHLQLSPSGRQLLFDLAEQPGLYLADLHNGTSTLVALGPNVAYRACWSGDEKYVAFKRFVNGYQVASVYDVTTCKITDFVRGSRVGIPSMAQNGSIAFTCGHMLYVADSNGAVQQKYSLNVYCNQTPLSPQGDRVAFTDQNDQLHILHLADGRTEPLTETDLGCFEPQWSPSGDALLAHSLDGRILVFDLRNHLRYDLGMGRHATWSDDRVLFTRVALDEQYQFKKIGIYSSSQDGSEGFFLTNTEEDFVAVSGSRLLYNDCQKGLLMAADGQIMHLASAHGQERTMPSLVTPLALRYFDIPYLHQAYDTPDWFNGNWACGATAAVMCLSYYGLLKKWPTTASRPFAHISDYGRYVCEKYTYNGFTFDIGGADPNGNTGWGGYGYIIKNNWRDTKQYMADYAQLHGLSSSVDWNPSRSKIQIEMNAKMPTVVLTDLTSAGHYVTAIGYDQEATSIMFNDPWGDKNFGYANYQGQRAVYDWPGFSNGHANLETVHCFIYFRGQRPDLTVQGLAKADTASLFTSYTLAAQISNPGMIASAPCMARLVLSTNAYYDSTDLKLAEQSIPSLSVADSLNICLTYTLPDTVLSGMYALGLQIDSDNVNAELSEINNFMYTRLTVIGRPKLYGVSPKENDIISETRPVISCFYSDKTAAIDLTRVQMHLDQEDVSATAWRDAAFVNYQPVAPLSPGEHTITITVFNKAGIQNQKTWRFTVQSNTAVNAQQNPDSFNLFAGYPNPFNDRVTLCIRLTAPTHANVEIFSITGAHVATLHKGRLHEQNLYWDGCSDAGVPAAGGVYLCRLTSALYQKTIRLVLLK